MGSRVARRIAPLATFGLALLATLSVAMPSRTAPVAPPSRSAPAASPAAQQDAEIIWSKAAALVPTRLLFPQGFDADRPATLVIALHGYGSSAEAFSRVGDRLAEAGLLVALPQPPYAFLVEGRLGFDWTLHHLDDDVLSNRATLPLIEDFLPSLVADISERHSVDRVYVLGFSQGAVLAMGTAIFNPDVFDGAVSFGLPAFTLGWFPGNSFAEGRSVDVLLVHGDADDRAPFAVSEAARDRLAAAGYDVTLHGFRGGHSVPDEQLDYVARWIRENAGR